MIKLYYWKGVPNAGDYFSSWLLTKMNIDFEYDLRADIGITGSILSCGYLNNAKIWGCGFSNSNETRHNKNVYAVRGNLSKQKLNLNDVATGDPGLLASHFYKTNVSKKYKYGIVSHYIDYDFFRKIKLPKDTRLITMGTNDVESVLDRINECEFILSSSLHGVIFSHSYGIPALHIKHKDLASKKSFKFLDYYSVFELKYLMKTINTENDLNWNEFNLLYNNKTLFVPSQNEIQQVQHNLLNAFPYKNLLS